MDSKGSFSPLPEMTKNTFVLQVPTSAEDERRIRSLGWLLIDVNMRSELLVEANTLMRGFLLRRQIEAVKSTFQFYNVDERMRTHDIAYDRDMVHTFGEFQAVLTFSQVPI